MMLLRGVSALVILVVLWQCVVSLFQLPPYILPGPILVFHAFASQFPLIAQQSLPTITEALLGFSLALIIGCLAALVMALFRPLGLWLMPLLIISQAIPTFAIAPILVLWLGYGVASKIITTMIMLFFPITSACFDGLRATNLEWLLLGKTMGGNKWRLLWHIRLPAALPRLASGIRVAAVMAPMGAVVGEWVGSSKGLGYLMLNANARMEIDMMFAALIAIIAFALILYFSVDALLKRYIPWQ